MKLERRNEKGIETLGNESMADCLHRPKPTLIVRGRDDAVRIGSLQDEIGVTANGTLQEMSADGSTIHLVT